MFIAMNGFRVAKGSEAAFEQVWLSRDSHLDKVPGFVEFHLLKGPEAEDHAVFSHAICLRKSVDTIKFGFGVRPRSPHGQEVPASAFGSPMLYEWWKGGHTPDWTTANAFVAARQKAAN